MGQVPTMGSQQQQQHHLLWHPGLRYDPTRWLAYAVQQSVEWARGTEQVFDHQRQLLGAQWTAMRRKPRFRPTRRPCRLGSIHGHTGGTIHGLLHRELFRLTYMPGTRFASYFP